jgi:hypothetical protein
MTTTKQTPRRRGSAATVMAAAAVAGVGALATAAPAKYIAISYSTATGGQCASISSSLSLPTWPGFTPWTMAAIEVELFSRSGSMRW